MSLGATKDAEALAGCPSRRIAGTIFTYNASPLT